MKFSLLSFYIVQGLQHIVEALETESSDTSKIDAIIQNDANSVGNLVSKSLSRSATPFSSS